MAPHEFFNQKTEHFNRTRFPDFLRCQVFSGCQEMENRKKLETGKNWKPEKTGNRKKLETGKTEKPRKRFR